MKRNRPSIKPLFRLLAMTLLAASLPRGLAQGTAFTYQGRLNSSAGPATGVYDLKCSIYDSTNNPGTLVAGPLTNSATAVSNGLFAVTLDFGAGAFNGAARWLEIAVRTNGDGAFTTLTPRQPLTPAPYALYALNAGTAASAASVAAADINGPLTLAQMPAGVLTNNASGVTLNGTFSGRFVSSNFRATQIIHSTGPLPILTYITTGGGTLLVFVSGSAYAANYAGTIGIMVSLSAGNININLPPVTLIANQTLTHMALTPQQSVVTGLPAGTYLLQLGPIDDVNTATDSGDNYCVTVLELPF